MNAWRMALRGGYKGKDLWPECEAQKVAVLTYKGIYGIDLSPYSPSNKPKKWNLKGSAPSSMISFAWRIRGGDLIFVRDSMKDNQMIACGTVKGPPGKLAYRFDAASKITSAHGVVWRHKIDVDWNKRFRPFKYHDRAPNKSVLLLNEQEIEAFCSDIPTVINESTRIGTQSDQEQKKQLEQAYPRSSPAMLSLIKPRHRALANAFIDWLRDVHSIKSKWERKGIDIRFNLDGEEIIGELKIAYGGGTRHAIREALGQLLEYNYYPGRDEFAQWLLVLDHEPDNKDISFIRALREERSLPLIIGWQTDSGFSFKPSWPD